MLSKCTLTVVFKYGNYAVTNRITQQSVLETLICCMKILQTKNGFCNCFILLLHSKIVLEV